MASRTIVALLITAAVLGIVVAPIPHSSADSTPIASGNYWIYQYDDIESGVRARGSIMIFLPQKNAKSVKDLGFAKLVFGMGQSVEYYVDGRGGGSIG